MILSGFFGDSDVRIFCDSGSIGLRQLVISPQDFFTWQELNSRNQEEEDVD